MFSFVLPTPSNQIYDDGISHDKKYSYSSIESATTFDASSKRQPRVVRTGPRRIVKVADTGFQRKPNTKEKNDNAKKRISIWKRRVVFELQLRPTSKSTACCTTLSYYAQHPSSPQDPLSSSSNPKVQFFVAFSDGGVMGMTAGSDLLGVTLVDVVNAYIPLPTHPTTLCPLPPNPLHHHTCHHIVHHNHHFIPLLTHPTALSVILAEKLTYERKGKIAWSAAKEDEVKSLRDALFKSQNECSDFMKPYRHRHTHTHTHIHTHIHTPTRPAATSAKMIYQTITNHINTASSSVKSPSLTFETNTNPLAARNPEDFSKEEIMSIL